MASATGRTGVDSRAAGPAQADRGLLQGLELEGGRNWPTAKPLRNHAVALVVGNFRSVRAKVQILAAQRNNRLAAWSLLAATGDGTHLLARHRADLRNQNGMYRFRASVFRLHYRTQPGSKFLFRRTLRQVGVTGHQLNFSSPESVAGRLGFGGFSRGNQRQSEPIGQERFEHQGREDRNITLFLLAKPRGEVDDRLPNRFRGHTFFTGQNLDQVLLVRLSQGKAVE